MSRPPGQPALAPRRLFGEAARAAVMELNSAGASDLEIARRLGFSVTCVNLHRRRLGLPANRNVEALRRKLAAALRRQLDRVGYPNLQAVRADAHREFARSRGWPEDLRVRHVQILNALAAGVPMTRRQIAEAIGMPWKGARSSLKSNDPEGSYLAHLARRGLVVVIRKAVPAPGTSPRRRLNLYTLSFEAGLILEAQCRQTVSTIPCPSPTSGSGPPSSARWATG